jgi:hypothetical protein
MTAITDIKYAFPRTVGFRNRQKSYDLFAVTLWSVVGLALTALTIWLGLGVQIEPLIGLG